jgi:hypothetical protein
VKYNEDTFADGGLPDAAELALYVAQLPSFSSFSVKRKALSVAFHVRLPSSLRSLAMTGGVTRSACSVEHIDSAGEGIILVGFSKQAFREGEAYMKRVRKSKSKKLKKTRKGKKTKKIKKLKKVRRPKKVLRKKVQKKKKVTKVKKTKKKVTAKRPAKKKKPAITPKPKKVIAAPAPIPVEKVTYTQENAIMCICTKCPIQAESTCAGEKVREMEAMMEKGMPEGMMPPPADLPGLYCSTGHATCTDLDFGKMCVCTVCPVWDKHKLGTGTPMGYFCRDGKAM